MKTPSRLEVVLRIKIKIADIAEDNRCKNKQLKKVIKIRGKSEARRPKTKQED